MFEKNFLLGVGITVASEKEVLEYIITGLQKQPEKYYVVTPNPELLVIANKDNNYKDILNSAKLALPDGIGVLFASQVLNKHLKERITGVDLMERLCKGVAEKPITIGFLGAGPGVAERTAECLVSRYPGLKVVFAQEEWGEVGESRVPRVPKVSKVSKEIKEAYGTRDSRAASGTPRNIDILFVAFGSPKQEIWISKNLSKLPVKVVIGVGGSFDFISGNVKRAPKWVRKIGLEWLFRLVNQPWRVKRQLSLLVFLLLVFKELFTPGSTK